MTERDLERSAQYNRRMAHKEQDFINTQPYGHPLRKAAETRRDLWHQLANEIDQYLAGQRALEDQDQLL